MLWCCGEIMTMFSDDTNPAAAPTKGRIDPLAQVRAYWEALRDGDTIPLRSQISPRGIESALSCTFLIERIAPGLARFRIAGMAFSDLMGMEVRGMPLSALFSPEARPILASKLETVFHSPAILTMDLIANSGICRPDMTARMLILPVRDNNGAMGIGLGCLDMTGKIGRSPRRFDIAHSTATMLVRATPPDAQPRRKAFAPQLVTSAKPREFAEPAARFDGCPGKTPPYLRLVE